MGIYTVPKRLMYGPRLQPTFEGPPGQRKKTVYDPATMTYDGSTGYYSKSHDSTTNQQTLIVGLNIQPFLTATINHMRVIDIRNPTAKFRLLVAIHASDDPTVAFRNKLEIIVQNNSGLPISNLMTADVVTDGNDHLIFFSQNAVIGANILYVDGVDSDDPTFVNRFATSGTLATGIGGMALGAQHDGANYWVDGEMGYIGFSNVYLTNPTDFYDPTNGLQEIDEIGWTEWGGVQPEFWDAQGEMNAHEGSEAQMTKNGGITGPS